MWLQVKSYDFYGEQDVLGEGLFGINRRQFKDK